MDLEADTMVDELFSQVNENEWSLLSERNDEIGSSSLLPRPVTEEGNVLQANNRCRYCIGTRKQCTEIN